MRTSIKTIEDHVLDLLDENRELLDERVEYCDPGVTLPVLIDRFVDTAAREVLLTAPVEAIDECRHLGGSNMRAVHTRADMATVALPPRFLRLLYFRMTDWQYGVVTPVAVGSEQHSLLAAEYVRVSRRRRRRGAVAVRHRGDVRELEVFGTYAGSQIAEFDWLEGPSLIDGMIDLPPGLLPEVCARIAGMVRQVVGTD